MVLICIALRISGDEHLFMYPLAISMSSWENVCSVPLPLFKLGVFSFFPLLSCMSSSYILDINPLSGRWFGEFSYIPYTAFHFVDDLLCWQLRCILISSFCTCLHLLAPISGLLSSAFWLVKPSALLCLGSPTTSPILICEREKKTTPLKIPILD